MNPGGAWHRRLTLWLALPTALVLLWAVVYPNLFVVGASVVEQGRMTLAAYRDFFGTRAELEALWASLWISVGSVVLSAVIGVPLAFVFSRYDFPGRSLFGALAALPVLLPPLVGVIAFLHDENVARTPLGGSYFRYSPHISTAHRARSGELRERPGRPPRDALAEVVRCVERTEQDRACEPGRRLLRAAGQGGRSRRSVTVAENG